MLYANTTPSYIRDLGIRGYSKAGWSWNQSPDDRMVRDNYKPWLLVIRLASSFLSL